MAAAALHVSPLLCTPWTEALMASVSLSCRLAGFSARLSLLLALSFVPSLSLSLSFSLWFPFLLPSRPPSLLLEGRSSRRVPVVISRKIPFPRSRPEKFQRARRLPANRHGMFGGTGRTSVGSWVGVKVRNVAGREIASFPNPLCVFWPDWPPRSPASLALDRRTVSPSLAFWLLGEAARGKQKVRESIFRSRTPLRSDARAAR